MDAKPITNLTADDFASFPVWEFDLDGESLPGRDETWVVPVFDLPVSCLSKWVVGVSLRIADREIVGMLGGIDLVDPSQTREFVHLSVWLGSSWFHLARYFDVDYARRGPLQLAASLGLSVTEVFPIQYVLSGVAEGHPEVIKGQIDSEPIVRLTDSERMNLIFHQ